MLGTIRFAPTVWEMGTMEQMCTVGMPALSNSLTSVAPQRVQVPQVEVRITACTSCSRSCRAMSRPKPWALSTDVALPTVAKYES